MVLFFVSCDFNLNKPEEHPEYCIEILQLNYYKYCDQDSDCWSDYLYHFSMAIATDYAFDEEIRENYLKTFKVVWNYLKSLPDQEFSFEMREYWLSQLAKFNLPEKEILSIVGEDWNHIQAELDNLKV